MNRGEMIAEAIRSYLKENGLKQSQLTGAMVADIANRVLDHIEQQHAKGARLATEEDWVASLSKEPHLAGVDVRRELAAAQFWCRNNRRLCSRKFFVNWLNRAAQTCAPLASPGGVGGAAATGRKFDLYTEPVGWRQSRAAQEAAYSGVDDETWARICERGWFELGTTERSAILTAMSRSNQ
jgi:hypothetical protein